ncbi:hypothetical protein V6N11_028835 [Hibiscus sabdariffa]|uniref:RNase H type-1 domain-containing protein n=1 Tax=Hibiscus sabdariffa TaxID=183260 RepID=A0ABR2PQZ1_9ROSI
MVVKVPESDEWCAPPPGCVKFNTGEAVKVSYGPAGIGKILRDHSEKVIVEFSKAIGLSDLASAESIAIREALNIFAASEWVNQVELIIKVDCAYVVYWVNNPSLTPFAFKDLINECLNADFNFS